MMVKLLRPLTEIEKAYSRGFERGFGHAMKMVADYAEHGASWKASGMEAREGQDAQRLDGEAATARPDAPTPPAIIGAKP